VGAAALAGATATRLGLPLDALIALIEQPRA
jgi:hypothetical protein